MKKLLAIFSICLLCLFSGCGKAETEEIDIADLEYFEFEAVTEIKEGQPDIYVVLKVLTSQYWQDIVKGVTDAGNDLGCNVYIGSSVGEAEWQIQQQLLEEAVEAGADAIVLAPGNSSALSECVSQIHSEGIPVVLVDTILNDTDAFDTCYMTDNLHAGELAAEEMIRLLRENGVSEEESASIAIQISSVASQTLIDRLAGFNQYWALNAPQSWKVLDEVKSNNGDASVAKQNCIDFLNDNPDLKGVFGCNNSSTVGFANGLTESGRTDIIMLGFDYADETAELVGSDEWKASSVVQNQYDMGYEGLKKIVEILDGQDVGYKFIDTGTRVITQENHIDYEQSLAGDK